MMPFLTSDLELLAKGLKKTLKNELAHAENASPNMQFVACNVAGAAKEGILQKALHKNLGVNMGEIDWLRSAKELCGVKNAYEIPDKLGADRFAALIGARQCCKSDCVVICAGTATTIDYLDAHGVFRGGVILPGLRLMEESLYIRTAGLPLADGIFQAEPKNTGDAIKTGCVSAQIGAIKERLKRVPNNAQIILTGGAANAISAHLELPHIINERLILEGLVAFKKMRG